MTLALTVQEPLDATEPLDRPKVMPPATAKGVPPGQVLDRFGGLAMTMPAGNVSENAKTVKACAFALLTCIVNVDGKFAVMVEGLKDLATTGGVSGVLTADTLIVKAGPAPSGSIAAVFVMIAGGLGLTST